MNRASRKTIQSPQHAKSFNPNRSRFLLRSIRSELERLQGRQIFYEELGRYAGQAASTVFDKLQKSEHPQIDALLGWLERLPSESRSRLVDAACRCLPSLDHPRLSHDPVQVSHLKALMEKPSGLTLITGGNEGLRTFLMTAIGHGIGALRAAQIVTGIDRFRPDWHVPVDGVAYLGCLCLDERKNSDESIMHAWSTAVDLQRPMLLLNGVISLAPRLAIEIVDRIRTHHIFVADEEGAVPLRKTQFLNALSQVIRVSANERDQLQLKFQA